MKLSEITQNKIESKPLVEGFDSYTVSGSDGASDFASKLDKVIAKEIFDAMKFKGNEYNPSGDIEVAIVISTLLETADFLPSVQKLLAEIKPSIDKQIEFVERSKSPDKNLHLKTLKEILNKIKFLKI